MFNIVSDSRLNSRIFPRVNFVGKYGRPPLSVPASVKIRIASGVCFVRSYTIILSSSNARRNEWKGAVDRAFDTQNTMRRDHGRVRLVETYRVGFFKKPLAFS